MPEELLELALQQLDEQEVQDEEVHETPPSSKAPTSSDGEAADEGEPQMHALQLQQQPPHPQGVEQLG